MSSTEPLVPATNPARAAEAMHAREDVGGLVLAETLQSAIDGEEILESGRTWCSSDSDDQLREPYIRYPAAVDLAGCPPEDVTAVWHSHTTPGQVANPEHSLPDIANVAFGRVDASIIPGTHSDHVLVAAADREAMQREFRNTLGADVDSTQAVADAITSGRVSSPSITRDRLNEAFEPLMQRVDVHRPDLAAVADELFDGDTDPVEDLICDGEHDARTDPTVPGGDRVVDTPSGLRSASVFRREARVASSGLRDTLGEFDITGTVVGTTVGMFTSRLLERAVFGE